MSKFCVLFLSEIICRLKTLLGKLLGCLLNWIIFLAFSFDVCPFSYTTHPFLEREREHMTTAEWSEACVNVVLHKLASGFNFS